MYGDTSWGHNEPRRVGRGWGGGDHSSSDVDMGRARAWGDRLGSGCLQCGRVEIEMSCGRERLGVGSWRWLVDANGVWLWVCRLRIFLGFRFMGLVLNMVHIIVELVSRVSIG